jgi:tripartite-type tricarboxylate transporter receptor subunit TctC
MTTTDKPDDIANRADMPTSDSRRRVLRLATLACAGSAAFGARAQPAVSTYPAKSVRVIVGFTAGGTTDILARAVCERLGERWKQSFVIDNKPGAGGNIGTELAVRSPADGYTLVVASVGPLAVNPTLYKKLAVNPVTDLAPVILLADVPNVLVVHPSLPINSVDEFIAYSKANPGKMNYGSTGTGTSSHLSGSMLGKRANLEVTHIPYKGADALNDLLAGRLQFMFATIPSVIQHIRANSLRAIAVSSAKRSRSMPDIPTVAERGFPGFDSGSWFGMLAPKGTPDAIIQQINKAVNEIIAQPALQQQMIKEGADPVGGTAEWFGQFHKKEYERWKQIVIDSGASIS